MKFLGKTAVVLTAWMLGTAAAWAGVQVDDPWARATVPGQPSSGVFMRLRADGDMRLVAAESDAAHHVEIHEMALQDNVMRMRQIPALELPAGQTVALAPGGYHIMLIDLARQLKEGEQFRLTLAFERDGKRETMTLDVPVRPLTYRAPEAKAGAQASMGVGAESADGMRHAQPPASHHAPPMAHAQPTRHAHAQHAKPAAQGEPPAGILAENCWIRAMPGRLPSAGYFKVRNTSDQAIALIGAQSQAFGHVMLHETRTEDGQARMAHAERIDVPAQGELVFAPKGYHVMLEVPLRALEVGATETLLLQFDRGGPLPVACAVRPPTAME